MEHSPFWEANRCQSSQETPGILYKPKAHYRTVTILSQPKPLHAPIQIIEDPF